MHTDIKSWLARNALDAYADAFLENEITVESLEDLTEDDLRELGLPMGPRKRALRAIRELKAESARAGDAAHRHAERRRLTILFCDIAGSTALSRQLDPEDLREVMRQCHDVMTEAIERYGGHVAKYLGDGVLAYFGWPEAQEDQAERAARAALEAVGGVEGLGSAAGARLAGRAGMATGLVVVGDLAGEAMSEVDAVTGETPNLAARLQAVAELGEVVADAATRALLPEAFRVEDRGTQALKGYDHPVGVWAIRDASDTASRFEASRGIRVTPLVGRRTELAQLAKCWEAAARGTGRLVLISGEPGIGKSRLTAGLIEAVGTRPENMLQLQCVPYLTETPFHPVINELRRRLEGAEGDAARRERLDRVLEAEGMTDRQTNALLADLLDLREAENGREAELTPQERREQTLGAVVERLRARAARRPQLVVIEDAHWADSASRELIARLSDISAGERIMVLVTHRPEWQPPLPDARDVTAIRLGPLDNAACEKIAREATEESLNEAALAALLERAGGVPLFVEELARSVPQEGGGVPATLEASLLARLDRLGGDSQEVVRTGAVIGREFGQPLLLAVVTIAPEKVGRALDEIVRSGLAVADTESSRPRYVFRHALIQEAAYSSLLRARRRDLHRTIGAALDAGVGGELSVLPEIIARHYDLGEAPEHSVAFWHRAGDAAARRYANREAIGHYTHALDALGRAPKTGESASTELDLLVGRAASRRIVDEVAAALDDLEGGERLARQLGRNADLAHIHHLRGNLFFARGDVERCLEEHEASRRVAHDAGLTEAEAGALGGLGDAHFARGTMLSGLRHLEACVEISRAQGFAAIEMANISMLGMMQFYAARIDEALVSGARAVELAQAAGNPRAEIIGHYAISSAALEANDPDRVIASGQRAVRLAREIGSKLLEAGGWANTGNGYAAAGRYGDASEALGRADSLNRQVSMKFAGAETLAAMAWAAPDAATAEACISEGAKVLEDGGLVSNGLEFHRHAMDALLRFGKWDDVLVHADALERATAAEPLPLCSFYVERGRLLARCKGDPSLNAESRAAAARLYERGMAAGLKFGCALLAAV